MGHDTLRDWLALPLEARREKATDALAAVRRDQAELNTYTEVAAADLTMPEQPGELAAVPFAVKDNIDVKGFATTAGTPALRGNRPQTDNSAVRALRDSGAFVAGKANMHELAFGLTSNNATFGPALNPCDPSRVSGGSSGGSAAAVATGAVPFALGTDTGASVTTPSAYCGVVGFRPSTGRYPGDGVLHLAWTRDAIGVHANTVEDVQLIDQIITRTSVAPARKELSAVRLGVPPELLAEAEPEVARVLEQALEQLDKAGVTLVEAGVPGALEKAAAGFSMVFYETPLNFASYLCNAAAEYRDLRVEEVAAQIASPDVQAMFKFMLDEPISVERYEQDASIRNELRRAYQETFAERRLDALLYPTTLTVAPPLGSDDSIVLNGVEREMFPVATRNVAPGGLAGAPQISLPASRGAGELPIGLTLEGGIGTDEALLGLAAQLHPFF